MNAHLVEPASKAQSGFGAAVQLVKSGVQISRAQLDRQALP
jgi:hypothetical protein